MGQIVVYLFFIVVGICALFRPWIGVCAAYLIVVLTPQSIWPWNFYGIRPFFYIAVPTFIGFIFLLFRGKIDFSFWKTKISFFLALTWLFIILSYFFGPYVNREHFIFDPQDIFKQVNKTFFFYFLAVLLIDNPKKLKVLSLVMLLSTIYMIYWANDQYLSRSYFGRLHGPIPPTGGGIYKDENAFAMLFVTGLPFIYYFGFLFKKTFLRLLLWLIIPLGWHAAFLTGSRGGLLGLGTIVFTASLRSTHKFIGFLLIPALIVAYVWQGGSVLKERAKTIKSYEEETSAQSRLYAWSIAIKMIRDHPFTGVGFSSFMEAFTDYSDRRPMVAHNTFFQLMSESGVFAGLSFIMLFFFLFKDLFNNKLLIYKDNSPDILFLCYLNESLFVSFFGFLICSLFLSLEKFEILFFLFVLANNHIKISRDLLDSISVT